MFPGHQLPLHPSPTLKTCTRLLSPLSLSGTNQAAVEWRASWLWGWVAVMTVGWHYDGVGFYSLICQPFQEVHLVLASTEAETSVFPVSSSPCSNQWFRSLARNLLPCEFCFPSSVPTWGGNSNSPKTGPETSATLTEVVWTAGSWDSGAGVSTRPFLTS